MSRIPDSYLVKDIIKELERLYERVKVVNGKVTELEQIILDAEEMIQTTLYDYKERMAKLLNEK